MKKYGKKWRTLHPELATQPRTNDIQLAQEQKRLRNTPWDKDTIEMLRKEAYALIPTYMEKESFQRSVGKKKTIEIETTLDPKTLDCYEEYAEILKNLKNKYILSMPFPIDRHTCLPENLKDRLEYIVLEFIQNINDVFQVSIPNIGSHLFFVWNYDIVRHGIEPIGRFYIDILCKVLEGSTWYTRKERDGIFAKIKTEFEKSEFRKITDCVSSI